MLGTIQCAVSSELLREEVPPRCCQGSSWTLNPGWDLASFCPGAAARLSSPAAPLSMDIPSCALPLRQVSVGATGWGASGWDPQGAAWCPAPAMAGCCLPQASVPGVVAQPLGRGGGEVEREMPQPLPSPLVPGQPQAGARSPGSEVSRQRSRNAISHGSAANYRASVQRGVRHEGAFVSG